MSDNVNHPNHYTVGGIEVIDYIQAKLTPEQFEGYLLGNVIKYVSRHGHKNGYEDLRKAQWCLDRVIQGEEPTPPYNHPKAELDESELQALAEFVKWVRPKTKPGEIEKPDDSETPKSKIILPSHVTNYERYKGYYREGRTDEEFASDLNHILGLKDA